MSRKIQPQEIENLIVMLEKDLEWLRKQSNPDNATAHRYTRMFLSLALECKELRGIIEQAGLSSKEGTDARG